MEKRKTINGEDVLFAMSTLGFDNYVEPLKIYLQKYREVIYTVGYYYVYVINYKCYFRLQKQKKIYKPMRLYMKKFLMNLLVSVLYWCQTIIR